MIKNLITLLFTLIFVIENTGAVYALRPKSGRLSSVNELIQSLQPDSGNSQAAAGELFTLCSEGSSVLGKFSQKFALLASIIEMTKREISNGRELSDEIDGLFLQIEDMYEDCLKPLDFFNRIISAFQQIKPNAPVVETEAVRGGMLKICKNARRYLEAIRTHAMDSLWLIRDVYNREEYSDKQREKAGELTVLQTELLIKCSRAEKTFSLIGLYWKSRAYSSGAQLEIRAEDIDEYAADIRIELEEFIEGADFVFQALPVIVDILGRIKNKFVTLSSKEILERPADLFTFCQDLLSSLNENLEFSQKYISEAGSFTQGEIGFLISEKKELFNHFCRSLSYNLQTIVPTCDWAVKVCKASTQTAEGADYSIIADELDTAYKDALSRALHIKRDLLNLAVKWQNTGDGKSSSAGSAEEAVEKGKESPRHSFPHSKQCAEEPKASTGFNQPGPFDSDRVKRAFQSSA